MRSGFGRPPKIHLQMGFRHNGCDDDCGFIDGVNTFVEKPLILIISNSGQLKLVELYPLWHGNVHIWRTLIFQIQM